MARAGRAAEALATAEALLQANEALMHAQVLREGELVYGTQLGSISTAELERLIAHARPRIDKIRRVIERLLASAWQRASASVQTRAELADAEAALEDLRARLDGLRGELLTRHDLAPAVLEALEELPGPNLARFQLEVLEPLGACATAEAQWGLPVDVLAEVRNGLGDSPR